MTMNANGRPKTYLVETADENDNTLVGDDYYEQVPEVISIIYLISTATKEYHSKPSVCYVFTN